MQHTNFPQDVNRSSPGIGHNSAAIDWRDYGGFIVEARDSREHPIIGYGKPVKPADEERGSHSRNEAWRDLLHECRYQEGYVMNGGQKMLVRRGELVGAVSWLAHRWNWTPKTVRVFLDKLEAEGMIGRFRADVTERHKGNRTGNQANVIKVCNYEKFNTGGATQRQLEGQSSGNQGAIEGPHNKEEQGKQGNNTAPTSGAPDRYRELSEKLLNACNGALDNPANCMGLLALTIPEMWMREGADLDLDIIPTLTAAGRRYHGKRIRDWSYFTGMVMEAFGRRMRGLPEVETSAPKRQREAEERAAALREQNEKLRREYGFDKEVPAHG